MEQDKTPDSSAYFADYGETLINNGYHIIPIKPGEKRPHPQLKDWPKLKMDATRHRDMCRQGFGKCGIGIITENVPAIDVDVEDPDVVRELGLFIGSVLGEVPVRVGNAPKALFMCRTKRPFRKMMSKQYDDGWGGKPRVEILGEGQQFVAFHIHPKTQLPYQWTTDSSPYNTHLDDLPILSEEMAIQILAKFEELAEAEGWAEIEGRTIHRQTRTTDDDYDPFVEDEPKADISKEVLRELLNHIPSDIGNDDWVRVGMGLYHQFDGTDEGLDMWKEWSEFGYDNYNARVCETRWRSFNIDNKGKNPTTVRTLIKWAKEFINDANVKLVSHLTSQFNEADTAEEWSAVAKECRTSTLSTLQREGLVSTARLAYQRITGAKVNTPAIRKELEYTYDVKGMPEWCRDWVWVAEDECFFNTKTKITLSKQGFDTTFLREAKTKKDVIEDKDKASNPAHVMALTIYGIPKVDSMMYSPRNDPFFEYQGRQMVNTYDRDLCPVTPERLLPRDKANIRRVEEHIQHLIEDPREQAIFLSWLAYTVQNPGRKANWAVLLQGTEGDGKSFFACLLRAVMGQTNVAMLNASSFKSDFTGWAIGQCVAAVEEVRLQGEGKFDILNKIKPYITNEIVEIHAKGKTQFNAENTTNYILFTNFQDAMPLNNNDRRYFVLFSRWQTREALAAFRETHPDYYRQLYNAIAESAGAIRGWLLDHELDDQFDPRGDAPITKAHQIMVRKAMSEEFRTIMELISENRYEGITPELVNLTQVGDIMRERDMEEVNRNRWTLIMGREGWQPLEGRIKIDGRFCKFYSPSPQLFTQDGSIGGQVSVKKIRDHLAKRPKYEPEDPFDDDL